MICLADGIPVIPGFAAFGVSLFVGWMVARKNRKIDMVEALKNAK